MPYMRIESNKFWAWVVVSLLVGLGIGLVIMLVRTGSLSDQIRVLRNQVAAAGTSSTASAGAQGQLASDEASITALTSQNAQLTSDLAAANAQIASLQGSGSTTTTTTTTTAPTIVLTSRTVTPSTVTTVGTITMTAKVTGGPTKVTMRVYNSSKSYDKTFTLKKISTSGSTETWRATAKAPTKAGTYSYFAIATLGSQSVTKVGASPSTFKVK
jgi:hypothetical protein